MKLEICFEIRSMESTLTRVRSKLDCITHYLTPLLPIANCHMVEFFTLNHWQTLLPTALRKSLESLELNDAVERFWKAAEYTNTAENSELSSWISKSRSHCVSPNNDYYLTEEQCMQRVTEWGGSARPHIRIKEFMNPKKSYEVALLSRMVASVSEVCGATCCVEAGGGRGALAASLSLAHQMAALSIDCAPNSERAATQRTKAMQKAWRALAITEDGSPTELQPHKGRHHFATGFVTSSTDLAAIVRQHFPDLDDVKLILTGLHTCGNLGPDSLRIFVSQPSTAALLNVPCCYNLLSESVDDQLFDVFHKEYACGDHLAQGFPMSQHLRGYTLGRNARMLAAQSMARVAAQRQMPARTLLYRALLQVLIKQHRPDYSPPEGKLKRLSHCEEFQQYFKEADSILKLELFDKLTPKFLDNHRDLEKQWKELVLFYYVRLCLAQVVESVILLDRLVFLLEHGFQKVFLVKLFDPVISPRCHSIFAVR